MSDINRELLEALAEAAYTYRLAVVASQHGPVPVAVVRDAKNALYDLIDEYSVEVAARNEYD